VGPCAHSIGLRSEDGTSAVIAAGGAPLTSAGTLRGEKALRQIDALKWGMSSGARPPQIVRVLIADDEALVRGGIAMLLSAQSDIEVVAEAATGEEAVDQARALRPDVVLMDLRMPGTDGIQATAQLTQDPSRDEPNQLTKVLVLTTFKDDDSVYGALRAGASGLLIKDHAPGHLVEAVHAVAAGDSWIDSAVAAQVLQALAAMPQAGRPGASVSKLTAREQEILVLMASGLTNAQITARLVLSEATVRTHVSRILMKTGSRDRTQAVVLAYRSGLVHIPPVG
jgi:DNA-binding NarL/FixJ family response regulator